MGREMTAKAPETRGLCQSVFRRADARQRRVCADGAGVFDQPVGARAGPGQAATDAQARCAMAEWVDRNAPWVLAVEFVIMLVTGVVAMLTDRWFSPRKKPQSPAKA